MADVPDLYLITAARRDDYIIKIRNLLYLAERSNRRFFLSLIEPAARKFDVLNAKRSIDLGRRHLIRTHFIRIDPDVYLPFAAADDRNLADAVNGFDAFFDLLFRDLRDFAKIFRRRNDDAQNRSRVRIEL